VLPSRLSRLDALYRISGRRFVVALTRIACEDLKAVDLLGKNDPYVALQFGSSWSAKTECKDNAGAEAEWGGLQISFVATEIVLKSEPLRLQVLDYNGLRSHVTIGEATLSLASLVASSIGRESELSVDIIDSSGVKSGRVTVTIRAEPRVNVSVHRIVCSSMTNVEMLGHNDPFVQLQFHAWEDQTDYLDGAGAQAEWYL